MTIMEFLLARIAEDEARWSMLATSRPAIGKHLLAECEAKRRIVEQVEQLRSMVPAHVIGDGDEHELVIVEWVDGSVLPALASVYADHPDFDPSWRLP